MHELILWCGFLGAWLLVAGPVYQAGLELEAEEFEFDRLRKLSAQVPAPAQVSRWWWLLPPVRLVLQRVRSNRYQHMIIEVMSDEDYEAASTFINKATGWLYVGVGGLLIAAKETYELAEHYEWPIAIFWALLVVMLAVAIANALARMAHSARERKRRRGRAALPASVD